MKSIPMKVLPAHNWFSVVIPIIFSNYNAFQLSEKLGRKPEGSNGRPFIDHLEITLDVNDPLAEEEMDGSMTPSWG